MAKIWRMFKLDKTCLKWFLHSHSNVYRSLMVAILKQFQIVMILLKVYLTTSHNRALNH